MSEMVVGFFVFVAAPCLIVIGIVLGRLLFGKSESKPTRQSDAAATARTIQQLANEGAIDEELRAKLFMLLRESYERGREVLPTRATEPPRPAIAKQPVVRESAATAPVTAPPQRVIDEQSPIEAEIVEEVAMPAFVHPLDAPDPIAVPSPTLPQQRRRALADVLQAFMQAKNIRWGELVSGLLIVGCSVALVISLRREIESLSEKFIYLPALLFMLATAAIHAAGNYTLRRWNLQTTSRGVLIIATLLIPINFLAAIIITGPESQQLSPFHPLYLSSVAVGILAFGTMAYFAGQALMREGSWRLWIGVMGTSVGQLLINRLADRGATALSASLLVSLPLIAYLVATISQLQVANRRPRIGMILAVDTLLVLGITSFALAAPIGLLLSKSESISMALAWLSTPLSLPAVVVLTTGLALHRRVSSTRLATLKTVGTALALTGGVMMLTAVVFAWPEPHLLITVGVFSFTSLTLLAVIGRLPALHVPAIGCGALACVVGFHLLQGSFAGYEANLARRMYDLFFLGRTSVVLTVLAIVAASVTGLLLHQGRRASAISYLAGSGGIAALSIFIAITVGFFGASGQEPNLASAILLFYTVVLLVASYFVPTAALTWGGSALLLLGCIHCVGWNTVVQDWLADVSLLPTRPVLVGTLLHGVMVVMAACLLSCRESSRSFTAASYRWQHLIAPLTLSALLASTLVLPSSALVVEQRFGEHAWYMAALSLIWLVATFVHRSPFSFSVFQALATLAIVFTTTSVCQQQSWWSGTLLSPQHLQAVFGTLAVWCMAWSFGRRVLRRRWPDIAEVMRSSETTVDDVVFAATVAGMFVMCVVACACGAAEELGINEPTSSLVAPMWTNVFTIGSWTTVILLALAAAGSLIERFSVITLSAAFLIAAIAAMLIGGSVYDMLAVASGLRWSFAVLGVVLTIAICMSSRIEAAVRRSTWLEWGELPTGLSEIARSWTLGLCAVPILGLTTASLVQAAAGHAPNGPTTESFFSEIGSELSYGVPLALLVAVLIAHAVREKQTSLMLAASGVFQYLVNLAYFLPILKDPSATFDWPVAIGCLQWNSLGLAIFALGWLGVRRWVDVRHNADSQAAFDRCLVVQVVAALAATTATASLATGIVISVPDDLTRFAELGSWLSYLVCFLGFGATAWLVRTRLERFGISLLLGFLFAIGGPLAVSLEGSGGTWAAFHVMMLVWLSIALVGSVFVWMSPSLSSGSREASDSELSQVQLPITSVQWATAFIAFSVLLALRAAPFDPDTPWWSFGTTLSAACLAGAVGTRLRRQTFAFGSVLLSAVAVTILWWGAWPNDELLGVIELIQLNLVAAVLGALFWLSAEVRSQKRLDCSFDPSSPFAVHRAVAIVANVVLLVIVFLGFALTGFFEAERKDIDIAGLTGWLLLPLLGCLVIGSLWDARMKLAIAVVFAWGLIAMLMLLDEVDQWRDFDGQTVFVLTGLATAAYVALTGHAWKFGANLAAIGNRLGMPDTVKHLKRTRSWLPIVTLLITAMIVVIELLIVLAFDERWMRMSAGFALLPLAYAVSCHAQQQRRKTMQYASLILASIAAVYTVWADIEPHWRATFVLERAVRLLMVLAGLAFLYAIPLSRWTERRGDWFPIVRRMAVWCGGAAIVALVGVLLLELGSFEPGIGVPFGHPYEVFAVAIVLVGLIIAFIALALSPERDPLALSEQGRMGYVYAAQVVGALLFAHIYLTNPSLFSGRIRAYWPYIVMAIAFAGVGVGELFQRRGLRVLAEPLQRTGGFLPLLPALGWWLNQRLEIDAAGHYSLLLFFAGLFYAALSMLRRSYISGVAAAVAGNAALWAVLADYEPLSLMKHPQFWLIPPAASMLLASHLNRRQLSESQLTATRYLCLLVIYVSSTADIFIEGIGNSLWEPMVLATLSVIGVFVGIGLQIRAFLYLGVTFVFLSVISMVWHAYAKVQHVGIWWGFGILLGLLILTFFGVFEKKRPELLRLVESMRRWEP